jgi:PAS domain S-box-containing protein
MVCFFRFSGLDKNYLELFTIKTCLSHLLQGKSVMSHQAASDALIRSIGNNLPNCMLYQVIRNPDGSRRFAYVSDAVRRFYGCSPDEAMADANLIYSRVMEEDRLRVWNEEENANQCFSTFSTEVRMKNPSGDIRWSYFASSPRMLEDGSTCWDGIEIDITERKQVEEKLLQQAEELTVLKELGREVNASLSLEETSSAGLKGMLKAVRPDIAFLFLRQGERLTLQNVLPSNARLRMENIPEHRVGECICGLAITENKPLFSLNIFDDPRCTWEECKQSGIKSFAALPLRDSQKAIGVIGLASETIRDFEKQAGFLETLASQISGALINARLFNNVQRELAERRRVEDALQNLSSRQNALLSAIPDIIMEVNSDKVYTWANQAGLAFFGKDVIGREAGFYFEGVQDTYATVQPLFEGGEDVIYVESFQRRADGQKRLLAWWCRVLKDEKGDVIGALSSARDITEQKSLEKQLLQAQKMESIGRLAGGVAHDFNNMLQSILGHSDLALSDIADDHPLHENLLEIQKAASRSAELTRQLLAFARKQTVSPRVLDLNDTVTGMLKMLRRLIGEDIELIWKPGANLWPIKMDPTQVDQILANLGVNARDAITGVGNLTIETDNKFLDETHPDVHAGLIPGDYIRLSVSDDGCGMEKDVLRNIFDPFFTTKEVGKGTGLGLATVYGIVKQNKGWINVYSEPDKGTIFNIYLPRASYKTEPLPPKKDIKPAQGTETVLFVEDDDSILQLGAAILKRFGYTVYTARSPGEALTIARKQKDTIHLLITDVVMPGMNGREMRDKITALRPEIKTLFMSGYTADIIAHHGVLESDIHFLQKPFSVNNLAVKVREALEKG